MANTISKFSTLFPFKYQEGGSFKVGIGFTVHTDPLQGSFVEIFLDIQNGLDSQYFNGIIGEDTLINTVLTAKKDAQQTQEIPIRIRVFATQIIPPGTKKLLIEKTEFITVEKECVHDTEEILEKCLDGSIKKMRTCKFGEWIEEKLTCPEDKIVKISKKKGIGLIIGGISLWWLLLLLRSKRE